MVRRKFCCPILQYPRTLFRVVERLQFGIGVVIAVVAGFYNKGLDVFAHLLSKCAVVEVTAVSIKEKYLVVYKVGAAYVGKLGHGFYTPVSIHIPIWCVIDFPVQWYIIVQILVVVLGLVQNYGWHEQFTISLSKDK